MNKLVKTILIWFSIFIVSSAIASTIFVTSSGFLNYTSGNIEKININEQYNSPINNIENIYVSSLSTNVEIVKRNSSEISFELTGFYVNNSYTEPPRLNINEDEKNIYVSIEYPKRILNLGMAQRELKLKVFIPETYNQSLKIKTASGHIKSNNLNLESLKAYSISGDINLENLFTKSADISSTSGDIISENLNSTYLELASVSGNIKLNNCTPNKIKTTSGDIKIISIVDRDIEIKSTSGDIYIEELGDLNFKVNFESISGDFSGDQNSEGKFLIFVKTVSGNLRIS